VADFLELGELMCLDALERDESCGCHFRTEHQMADGEAKRDDQKFCHVAAWEFTGDGRRPNRHEEPLTFENVELAVRSYK
jgi:succinate dehydrogenase / fumarate reductase flavoprotein subunit